MHEIQDADSYGVVLINAKGEVLLREPSGHFGGYVWTFAKGRSEPGESPSQTAMREAFEETGYQVELLDVIPDVFAGTTTSSAFFLAGPLGRQGQHGSETSATRWVNFDDAVDLILQTKSKIGRDRDLAILRASRAVMERQPSVRRPATCREDWETAPLPHEWAELALDLSFDDAAMTRIRKGFLPKSMDDRWFAWFEEPVLHLHRSWTGHCIHQVRFRDAQSGWRAISAKVNRDPRQYGETDDHADRNLIVRLIDKLFAESLEEPETDRSGDIRV